MQTGPGQLFVGSTQRFLHDRLPASLRCNHSIQYDETRGPQPQLVQHLRASSISSAFDPEAEALSFQLTTALQTGEAPLPTSTLPAKTARVPNSQQAQARERGPARSIWLRPIPAWLRPLWQGRFSSSSHSCPDL